MWYYSVRQRDIVKGSCGMEINIEKFQAKEISRYRK
jgi:hypothetical protein